jgi:hypothetical protein
MFDLQVIKYMNIKASLKEIIEFEKDFGNNLVLQKLVDRVNELLNTEKN